MPRRNMGLFALPLVLGGCMVGPKFTKPEAPVPAQWTDKGDPRIKTENALNAAPATVPGTTKLSRLDENIGAVAVQLTADDLRDIEASASVITPEGSRYPEHLEKMTYR